MHVSPLLVLTTVLCVTWKSQTKVLDSLSQRRGATYKRQGLLVTYKDNHEWEIRVKFRKHPSYNFPTIWEEKQTIVILTILWLFYIMHSVTPVTALLFTIKKSLRKPLQQTPHTTPTNLATVLINWVKTRKSFVATTDTSKIVQL
jgi:hypothetical protein